jgi:hypothetical protein
MRTVLIAAVSFTAGVCFASLLLYSYAREVQESAKPITFTSPTTARQYTIGVVSVDVVEPTH